ncbi:MAG: sn-glycerol-3-phosphate ABC transporter ATP-binding protein UgpC [Planctomycetes bacterium]|nr:sn-glycerol-3-phosphate ABC transporter ATP-binding protein UgpC [Planctomycetota bacterium]
MAQITLESISKTFPGKVQAVKDLSLTIADGQFVVLVGPSGCGKTTTLRLIAGLEELTSGTIRIGEKIVNKLHPKDRDIAMVFQDYALYPHMTVFKNMAFGLKMRKVAKKEINQRVHQTAQMLGITDLLDRKPHALSGGQQQRVAVGRAIVRNPQCFLLDEPLSNLDAKLRMQMRSELKSLHMRLMTTTIYVTHDQEEAMTLGDQVVVMANGEVQQIGKPLEIYQRPINRFVAGFVGMPPMNFLDGIIEKDNGQLCFCGSSNIKLQLSKEMQDAAANYVDKQVVAGIRPEALNNKSSTNSENYLALKVTLTEPLGDRTDVYCKTSDGQTIIARIANAENLSPGVDVRFDVEPSAVHLFECGEFGRHLFHCV